MCVIMNIIKGFLNFCHSHCNLFDQLPLPLCGPEESQVDHLRLGQLVQGYKQLHSAGLLSSVLSSQVI